MKVKRPLLSICIPTYNRGEVLEETLLHYLWNKEFDDDVEIVVLDNASSDMTEDVGRRYAARHSNIRYFRNSSNIRDRNFIKVLDLAEGEYLKLVNDWCYMTEAALRRVKDVIRSGLKIRKPLFFTNGWLFTRCVQPWMECASLEEFVQRVSSYVTSIGTFGCWRENWGVITGRDRYYEYMLMQQDWTYQIVEKGKGAIICNEPIYAYASMESKVRKGYNWFQIHMDKYFTIMLPYVKRGVISKATFKMDRQYVLWHFAGELCQTYIRHSQRRWQYETKGTLAILFHYYKADLYFYKFILTLPLRWLLKRNIRNYEC